jgi:hypothetical protein
MEIDHLTYYDRAVGFLADSLSQGTLVLFLGAGVSSGSHLPDWLSLVKAMREEVGLPNDTLDASADSLEHAVDQIRRLHYRDDERGFSELVQKCLYRGVTLDDSVLDSRLLTALGALMMNSRRGGVRRVVTLNFDSVLESYIWLNGLVPRVVVQPPVDEGAEDVRVYHPHGFLPHPGLNIEGSGFVILDSKSINLRLGKPYDSWIESLRHILSSGLILFIGLSKSSFRDRALAPLLTAVGEELKAKRPTGFWVLRSEASNEDEDNLEFLDRNIVPLRVSGYEKIPTLLLDICQRAAAGHKISVSAE